MKRTAPPSNVPAGKKTKKNSKGSATSFAAKDDLEDDNEADFLPVTDAASSGVAKDQGEYLSLVREQH
ncbi:MAG: hypothetical protein ACK55I_29175, partial [bacterium]